MGASLIVEAASTTNDLVGDGTTTAVILASNLIFEGLKKIDEGISPVTLRISLEKALPALLNYIDEVSIEVKDLSDLEKIAYISSGNKTVSSILKEAYSSVGKNGIITIEESKTSETYLDIVKGYTFDKGYLSPYMINNSEKALSELVNPYILITNQKITSMNTLVPFLEAAISKNLPILVICEDIESEVLNTLVLNKLRGVFNCVITKAPYYGEKQRKTLEDLAYATNARIVHNEDVTNPDIELGQASKVVINRDSTTIIDGRGNEEAINNRISELTKQYEIETSTYEKTQIETRIAKMKGLAAIIKVGGHTETIVKEKMLRCEDALNATKAAMQSGIIEGGGKVFYQLSNILLDLGVDELVEPILKNTLQTPFLQILENAGIKKEEILPTLTGDLWYDASTDEVVNNLEKGIIDPASVAKSGITNAISIASIFLTTEAAITNEEHKSITDDDLM
jgi:chaperonin GroEL